MDQLEALFQNHGQAVLVTAVICVVLAMAWLKHWIRFAWLCMVTMAVVMIVNVWMGDERPFAEYSKLPNGKEDWKDYIEDRVDDMADWVAYDMPGEARGLYVKLQDLWLDMRLKDDDDEGS